MLIDKDFDIKAWLEKAGEPVSNTAWIPGYEPDLPYIIYTDTVIRSGGDGINLRTDHILTIERYSEDGDENAALSALIEGAGIPYEHSLTWISGDDFFQEIYDLDEALIARD